MTDKKYIYDFEIYKNFCGVTFIPEDVSQQLIDTYVNIDILRIDAEDKINNYIKDVTFEDAIKKDDYLDNLQNNIIKYKADKKKILTAMGAKQFYIWNSLNGKDFHNDLLYIQNFFISHKIVTGYNSNNYYTSSL